MFSTMHTNCVLYWYTCCVALSVELSLKKSYQQTVMYELGVWRITKHDHVKKGIQLRLCCMLCVGEITEWGFDLHELPCLVPRTLCADVSAPDTGAPVCTVWYSGLRTQTAWMYKVCSNVTSDTSVYLDCWYGIWHPYNIGYEDFC